MFKISLYHIQSADQQCLFKNVFLPCLLNSFYYSFWKSLIIKAEVEEEEDSDRDGDDQEGLLFEAFLKKIFFRKS